MDELKSTYIQSLSERIKTLSASKNELETGGEAARKAIRSISHSLRGSGGTYGFPEISELAEKVELSSDADIPEALDALLRLLKSTISEYQTSR